MNDTIPGLTLFGRRFKPVALGVLVLMVGLAFANALDLGNYEHLVFQWIQAALAASAAALLVTGWVRHSTAFTRYGLALALFVYVARLVFLLLEDPLGDSVLLAFGVVIIIAGSYVLETHDAGGR